MSWAEGHPAVQELPWQREVTYGPGVERQSFAWGPWTAPLSKWLINFYFSRLQFAIHSLLSLILRLKAGSRCRGKIWGLGNRRPGSSINWEFGSAIWGWGGNLSPQWIISLICNMGVGPDLSVYKLVEILKKTKSIWWRNKASIISVPTFFSLHWFWGNT